MLVPSTATLGHPRSAELALYLLTRTDGTDIVRFVPMLTVSPRLHFLIGGELCGACGGSCGRWVALVVAPEPDGPGVVAQPASSAGDSRTRRGASRLAHGGLRVSHPGSEKL